MLDGVVIFLCFGVILSGVAARFSGWWVGCGVMLFCLIC